MKKRIAIVVLLLMGLLLWGGESQVAFCGDKNQGKSKTEVSRGKQNKIMHDFQKLAGKKDGSTIDVTWFVNQNIAKLSQENGSEMVDKLEKIQRDNLPALHEKYQAATVQTQLWQRMMDNVPFNNFAGIADPALEALLTETYSGGYKVATAEGMFFPVIDYEGYQKYQNYVQPDMAAYIDLMAVESAQPPTKDNGLVISWAEVLTRAANQEKFLTDYKKSDKGDAVRKLLGEYVVYAFYGTNNRPLFDLESGVMAPAAKSAYSNLTQGKKKDQGKFLQAMGAYLKELEDTKYRLSAHIESYRKRAAKHLASELDLNDMIKLP